MLGIKPRERKEPIHIKLTKAQIEAQNKFREKFPGTSIAPKTTLPVPTIQTPPAIPIVQPVPTTSPIATSLQGLRFTHAEKRAYILSLY